MTDGLDGLAAGVSIFVFGAYTFITYFQRIPGVHTRGESINCYSTRDPLTLRFSVPDWCSGQASCGGTRRPQIFMGDRCSRAQWRCRLSMLTQTELLAVIVGGLFVAVVLSDVIQIGSLKPPVNVSSGWHRSTITLAVGRKSRS